MKINADEQKGEECLIENEEFMNELPNKSIDELYHMKDLINKEIEFIKNRREGLKE